jgi:hypothetical protein
VKVRLARVQRRDVGGYIFAKPRSELDLFRLWLFVEGRKQTESQRVDSADEPSFGPPSNHPQSSEIGRPSK